MKCVSFVGETKSGPLVAVLVGYCFLAKLPASSSVMMSSLTRRFSLARVPSMFFGSGS